MTLSAIRNRNSQLSRGLQVRMMSFLKEVPGAFSM